MNKAHHTAARTIGMALDVLRFPLHGSRLIEASAGTGKTFTIATLYVRLVLGHGGQDGYRRALTPPEILVVTFTDAATQELRDRIRMRLAEAAAYFLAEPADAVFKPQGEDLLHDLRQEYAPQEWGACARKLQLAMEWMDEAAVSTIHGWCNRMLREHAFDSDSLFQQTLEKNAGPLMAEVVRDYWRTFIAPLDTASAQDVRAWWKSPDELHARIVSMLKYAPQLTVAQSPSISLCDARERKTSMLSDMKAPWPQWLPELRQLFDDAVAQKRVNGRQIQARYYTAWLDNLRAWCDDPVAAVPVLTDSAWERLSPAGLAEAWKGNPPDHPAFAALGELRARALALPTARNDIICHATAWISERFEQEQAQRAQMGFDDLLRHLDTALGGPNGTALAASMRAQFPVALIDEFQDTDPVQYRIFDAVYRLAHNSAESALILIGDPKQAIYGFRGADIYTYLRARAAVDGRLYVLKKNFRSTLAMVSAANHCFEVAEHREEGAGAFLFRKEEGNPVPFIAAEAHGRKDNLSIDGHAAPALTAWWMPSSDDGKPMAGGAYRDWMADVCAGEIVRLLTLSQQGKAGFAGDDGAQPLRPADMAVLVNTGRQSQAIRRALARRGVRSVYLSEGQSVFASAQAGEVEHWLKACAEPDDGRLLRAALATPVLGLAWDDLDVVNRDESEWERRVQQFRDYGRCWRDKGVLPMLRRLLDDFAVPARLQAHAADGQDASTGGERALTDLLHIAELLQQASVQIDGEHALVRYLAEMRRAAAQGEENDALTIRLESDADLVRVITVHKSKGLEYPLVFLPFAVAFRPVGPDDMPLTWHDESGNLKVSLEKNGAIQALADRERLGEDLRKLYVALTRARYATWLGVAPIANLESSAFGYLLGGGKQLAGQPLESLLMDWRAGNPHIAVQEAPPPPPHRYAGQAATPQAGHARVMARPVRENWWIASYSSLRTVQPESTPAPDTADEDVFVEGAAAMRDAPGPARESPREAPPVQGPSLGQIQLTLSNAGPLHDFPGGAEVGTFFHDLLEWAALHGFAEAAAQPDAVRDAVARRCSVRGWENWIDPLADWLRHFLSMPLSLTATPGQPGGHMPSVALAQLQPQSYVSEMEFWLAAHHVDVSRLDRLVHAYTLDNAKRPVLESTRMNGMLKGFIDLVFEHQGRYYVADYKSNRLGNDDASYGLAAMKDAILEKRYELQYVLYLFALHRLLKSRLPGYDYDLHVGGAVYLFLRGTHGETGGVFADRPPRELIDALDALFSKHAAGEAA